MILTDYYCFERLASKSKTRLDCTASTMSYPEFEEKRCTKPQRATEFIVSACGWLMTFLRTLSHWLRLMRTPGMGM